MASNVLCEIPRCLLCTNFIANPKDQRNISYGEGIKIKDVIRDLLVRNNNDYKNIITGSESESADYMESTNVVCKRYCFPSLTKLMKLRKDTKSL